MKQLIFLLLFTSAIFAQSGKSVLTQAQKDSILAMLEDSTGIVRVESYGAVGDGVTDDLDAFIAAYNSGAKYIRLDKNKTYKWNYNASIGRFLLEIDRSGFTIDGNGATILNDELETVYTFQIKADSVTIKNVNFVFSHDSAGRYQPTTSQKGIRSYNYDGGRQPIYDIVIDNCTFNKCAMQLLDAYRPRVTNCKFYDGVDQQLSLNSGEYGIFDNIQFYNSGGMNVQGTSGSMPFIVDSRSFDIYNNFSFTNCSSVGKLQADEDSCIGNILSNFNVEMKDTTGYDFIFAFYEVDYLFKDNVISNWVINANNAVNLSNMFEIKQGANNLEIQNVKVINSNGIKFAEIDAAQNISLSNISGGFKGLAAISGASSDIIIKDCKYITIYDTTAINISNVNNFSLLNSYINNTQTVDRNINIADTGKTTIENNILVGGNYGIYLSNTTKYASVTNNYISGYSTYGLFQRSRNNLITDNIFNATLGGTASAYIQAGTLMNNLFIGSPERHINATYPAVIKYNNLIGTASVYAIADLDSATISDNVGDLATELGEDAYTASLTNDYTGTNYFPYTNPVKWTLAVGDSVTQQQGSVYNEANAYAILGTDSMASHLSIVMPNTLSRIYQVTGNLPISSQFYFYLLMQAPINATFKLFIYDPNNTEYYNFTDSTWGASSYISVTPDNTLQYLRFPFVTDGSTRKARVNIEYVETTQSFNARFYYGNVSTNGNQGLVHIYNNVVTGYGSDNAFFTTASLPDATKIQIGTRVLDTTADILKTSDGTNWVSGGLDTLKLGKGFTFPTDSTGLNAGDIYNLSGTLKVKY